MDPKCPKTLQYRMNPESVICDYFEYSRENSYVKKSKQEIKVASSRCLIHITFFELDNIKYTVILHYIILYDFCQAQLQLAISVESELS